MIEQIAVPLAVLLLVIGLIVVTVIFARWYERERIKRELAELAQKLGQKSVEAHEKATQEGRRRWL